MNELPNNFYEQIEKYCLDLMDKNERNYFEIDMTNNPALKKAVEEYQILLATFDHKKHSDFVHNELNEIHQKSRSHTGLIINYLKLNINKYWRTASVAASVAFIASIITFSVARSIYKKDNRIQYQTLRNEINSLKKNQSDIKSEVDDVKKSKSIQPQGNAKYTGTCFAISQNGYFVTNHHVVNDANKIFIFTDSNTPHECSIVAVDKTNDLAILKINENDFYFSDKVPYSVKKYTPSITQRIYSLGFPKTDIVYNEGYVSSTTGFEGDSGKFQLELPSFPGVSGAPIIDESGNIIGIISGKQSESEGITYAVKSKPLLNLINELPNDFSKNEFASNYLKNSTRSQQIQKIEPFICVVKVYNK